MKILIDTNIYFSAFVFDKKILELLDYCYNNYTIYLSKKIFLEINEVFNRPKTKKLIPNFDQQILDNFLNKIIDECSQIEPQTKITICRDPKDNMFLELAEEINADYIITADNDLLELSQYKTTKILKPSEFINELQLEI